MLKLASSGENEGAWNETLQKRAAVNWRCQAKHRGDGTKPYGQRGSKLASSVEKERDGTKPFRQNGSED